MTLDPSQGMTQRNQMHVTKPSTNDTFSARMPISVSVPCAESKTGLLKNYTAYCIKINDFGRKVDIMHRFDDFAKLHECLMVTSGMSLPVLPAKQLFGGNDPKVVEERRPILEQLLKECVSNDKVLAEDAIYKFLDISSAGAIVAKFLVPATRREYLPRLVELLRPEMSNDMYRLFNDSVIRTLLYLLKEGSCTIGDEMAILDVLQFVLSRSDSHFLADSVDVQQIFLDLHGIPIVWKHLVTRSELKENCRRVLSALITSNFGKMEKFEKIVFHFLSDQNGIVQLLADIATDPLVCEIASKLIWFGLSTEVQTCLATHPKGLALLGALFSCSDANAQCLAGLTLCVLLSENMFEDQSKQARAVDGISQIVTKIVSSSTDLPKQSFLSAVCRGSSNGMRRILSCINGDVSDLPAWVIANAELPLEFIQSTANLVEICEAVVLKSGGSSIATQSCGKFLFRLYSEFSLLPAPRKDAREVVALLNNVGDNVSLNTEEGRKVIRSEYSQFKQFGSNLVENSSNRIKARMHKVDQYIAVTEFESGIRGYVDLCVQLETEVTDNISLVDQLGSQVSGSATESTGGAWIQPKGDLMKEWNISAFGMKCVLDRIHEMEAKLFLHESSSKSAEADSTNLQSVISKMRDEIVQVDQKAESLRNEATRFSTASAGAVDSELMLQRAQEAETKAKEQIAIREALRQSQDSLEAQLTQTRTEMAKHDTAASGVRRNLVETREGYALAGKQHEELELRVREEMKRVLSNWNSKLARNKASLLLIGQVFENFNSISKLIESENEQKDLVCEIISQLVLKLQKVQVDLQT